MSACRTFVLIALGVAAILAGVLGFYVQRELTAPEAFADRAMIVVDEPVVQRAIADRVTDEVSAALPGGLGATRTIVRDAVGEVLAAPAFRPALRASIISAHRQMVAGDGPVRVELGAVTDELLRQLLRSAPEVAALIPRRLTPQIVDLPADDPVVKTVRLGDRLSGLRWPLVLAGTLLFALAAALAQRGYRALLGAGIALAFAALSLAVALRAGRSLPLDDVQGIGTLTGVEARAAARATIDGVLGGLEHWLVGTAVCGVLLAGLALIVHALTPGGDRRSYG